jgi:hypothetical protein
VNYKNLYSDLTKKLENEIPITAYPIRELVQIFREKGKPITLKSKLTITSVINSGDISGIMCTVMENDGNVIACSLTHLIFDSKFQLYNDIIDYQRKRYKRINLLNQM